MFDPNECRFFPKCILYSVTGLKCAGCGTQRALHCLMHGEILQAIRYNCYMTVFLPLFVLGLYKGPFVNKHWYPYVGIGGMVLYSIVRNLPGVAF